ncbi:hypothetical protein Salat_1650900 [Sesamum alatum]|uniref:Uncharacterized protein n=1 Tax=Sesamum alatum TaxID=300844 RepID=A0AAE1Y727_9LAMI|nr:hypothetical protein Salat_1650900 [Sesamum alatum]
MAIGLENERVAEDGLQNFPAAGEAKLLVEFPGVIEAEDLVGLFGEEFFALSEESEVRISEENVFEVGNDRNESGGRCENNEEKHLKELLGSRRRSSEAPVPTKELETRRCRRRRSYDAVVFAF